MHDSYYLPVNWVDGMKINKSHFIAQENAMVYQLAQNTSCLLNELNYGMLPVGNSINGLKLFVSTDNQRKVKVRIQQCRAVTAGGYYIEFNEDTAIQDNITASPLASLPVDIKDLKKKATQFYVVLTINPFKREPFGLIDNAEIPPRLPFTVPLLSVDLIAVEEVKRNILGVFQLPVGKLIIEDQRVFIDEDYIPPSTTTSSHPELLEIYAGLEQFYSKMETYSLQIVQKIIQKKQTNDMAGIVQKLCENMLSFTASQLAEMRSVGVIQPPVYMFTRICYFSRLMKNIIDCYAGNAKDELIIYFAEWCNVSQGELESIITNLSIHQYDHLDINNSIDKVSLFTKVLSRLFYQLSRLDYIGKRREAGIFVKEEVVKQGQANQAPRRRNFLAEE